MKLTLCTDLDRTLLPNGFQPSDPQSIPLLQKLVQENDISLVYVTGRDKKLVLDAIYEYDLPVPDHAITDVGTRLYHLRADSTDKLNLKPNDYHWDEDCNYQQYLKKHWKQDKLDIVRTRIEDCYQLRLQEPEKQSRFKLSYYYGSETSQGSIEQDIKSLCDDTGLNCNIIMSHDETADIGLLDILPGDASKYHAIRFLMDKYVITTKEIIFFGDSGNDMEVMVSEIPSVLVNNTQESVKQEATRRAKLNHHEQQLFIAEGNFCGLNGNYCSGILEGLAWYYPEFESLICQYINS